MTKDALLKQTYESVSRASGVLAKMWKRQQALPSEAAELLAHLRAATCAAQELENQLRGCPPPKEGP